MDEPQDLSPALIEAINRRHLITTPLEPADLLFFFGTRHAVDEMVEAAADLWRRGIGVGPWSPAARPWARRMTKPRSWPAG
jgi:hypothetical protein